jgi:hypothetical protein
MRKLIYAINLTLDGGCDHTNGVPDDELFQKQNCFFTIISER